MRTLFTTLIFTAACAGPALAQDPMANARFEALWQEQQSANQMARQQSVALENQIGALEAQVQTETRLRDLETQRTAPRIATPGAGKAILTPVLPSNIDAWMAESNARVRAAGANRR